MYDMCDRLRNTGLTRATLPCKAFEKYDVVRAGNNSFRLVLHVDMHPPLGLLDVTHKNRKKNKNKQEQTRANKDRREKREGAADREERGERAGGQGGANNLRSFADVL